MRYFAGFVENLRYVLFLILFNINNGLPLIP